MINDDAHMDDAPSLPTLRTTLLARALERGALRFGDFELKSGRRSPYFFNMGELCSGEDLRVLGEAYAAAIVASGVEFDVLFGPAYKGIPLAAVTAMALSQRHGIDCGVTYNRKEAKAHGEGGRLVGASLAGRVLLIDDVITAGTAVREVLPLIDEAGGRLVGILTALDRQERGQGERSAVQELAAELQVPVTSIVTLDDLLAWLEASGRGEQRAMVAAYRDRFGVAAGA